MQIVRQYLDHIFLDVWLMYENKKKRKQTDLVMQIRNWDVRGHKITNAAAHSKYKNI